MPYCRYPRHLDPGSHRGQVGIQTATRIGNQFCRDVGRLYSRVVGKKGVDMRLHILEIIGVGWPLVAPRTARSIVRDCRWAAPEIFVVGKTLTDIGITYDLAVDAYSLALTPARSKLACSRDDQRIDHRTQNDEHGR